MICRKLQFPSILGNYSAFYFIIDVVFYDLTE